MQELQKRSAPIRYQLIRAQAETLPIRFCQKYITLFSKIKAPICGMTSVAGFFLMLGSAGGVETGALPEIKGYIWCFVGLGLFWLGAKAGGAL